MDSFYIYTHTAIGDTHPFYIGKGRGKRAYHTHNRSKYWNNLAKRGYIIDFEFTNLDESAANSLEIETRRLRKLKALEKV